MKRNENILFLDLSIYFHSFKRAFVTVCLWMIVETDLLLIPTERRTWNKTKCQSSKCNKRVTLSSFQNAHLPVFLTGFTLQCAALFQNFRKFFFSLPMPPHVLSDFVEWLTLFLERTLNVLCGVVIMNVCDKNGLFVWSRPGVGGDWRLF